MSRATQDTTRPRTASRTGLSPTMAGLSRPFRSPYRYHSVVLLPRSCIATEPVWALPRSLATTGGIIQLFSSPGGTKMFQFPPFASVPITYGCQPFRLAGCPIRKSRDQRIFAPTPGLSQLITSFIASVSQGIRHAPFFSFFCRCPTGMHRSTPRAAHTFSWAGSPVHRPRRASRRRLSLRLLILQSCLCQYVKDL